MEDIELVVKIPKEIYNHTQEYEIGGFNQENDTKLFIAIKNGTPLPKGHGKMIDAVSREQALSAIRNLYPSTPFIRLNLKKWQEENKKYFECENIIRALPSVIPVRKKGEWILEHNCWLRCSCCNRHDVSTSIF